MTAFFISQGERRGGRGTGQRYSSAAIFPDQAANQIKGKISDGLKFVPGVGDPAIDNGALLGHRARCGRDKRRHQIWIDPTTKGPAAPFIKSCRKASGEPVVIVGMEGLALLLDSKAHPHLASSSALRLSQVEDGREPKAACAKSQSIRSTNL